MGKQAKRKQIRDRTILETHPESYSSIDFIREIQQQGYQLQNIQRSPDLPSNKAEPQL
jgi:hypothetical protein